MDNTQLTSTVCTALMRIGTRVATGFDRYFAKQGITQAQFRLLLEIWEHGNTEGVAPSVLADRLLIERGTVSVLTNRMVARGWLARKAGENRRTFRLVLTAAGKRLLQRVTPRAVALAVHTLTGISHEQLGQMSANLELIERVLREHPLPDT